MNERIKELALQATTYIEPTFDSGEGWIFDKEKFAELIINDIGQIVSGLIVPETFEQDIGPYEHWNRALGTVALEIEQHFYGDAE
jgi:hypothetical protein